jgi:hypothetical protein
LLSESIEATEDVRSALAFKAAELREAAAPIPRPETDQSGSNGDRVAPECPRATGLWEVYSSDDEQLLSSALPAC